MKTLILTIIAILGITSFASAAKSENITLSVGQQKTADHGKIKINFISVIEDSRCPVDVTCIWAGSAKIKISVAKGRSKAKTYELNTGLDPRKVTVYGYDIRFVGLTPRPGEKVKMVALPKAATLSITKHGK